MANSRERERERERVKGDQKLENKNLLNFGQKIFFMCLLVFIFGFSFSGKASAATYYVDSSITDTNVASATPDFTTYDPITFSITGGSASVYKTIKDINAKVLAAGDVVRFKRGDTWTITDASYLQLYEAGSSGSSIVVTDYGSGELPIITSTAGSYAVRINASYWNISNLNIREGSPSLGLTGIITGINLSDCTFEGKNSIGSIISVGVNGITVTGCTFNPISATGDVIDASTGAGTLIFDDCIFTGTVSDYDINIIGNSNTTITNSTFTGNIDSYKGHITFQGSGKTGVHVLTGNTVNSSSNASWLFAGAGSNTYNLTVTDNEINLPNGDAIGGYSSAIWIAGQPAPIISRNTISMNDGMGAIYITGSAGSDAYNAVITDNIIYATDNIYGIRLGSESSDVDDGKLNGAIISGNQVYGPLYYDHSFSASGHAIFVGHNIATIERNYVNGGGYGLVIKGTDTDWNYSTDVSNNILVNCHSQPAVYFKGVRNIDFYNNTIYTDPQYIQHQPFGYVRLGKNNVGGVPTGINMYNNIIYGKYDSNFINVENGSGFISDYNLMTSNQGTDLLNLYNGAYSTLLEWQTAGYDTNSITGNPYFSDTNTVNFHLLPLSPAIDAGTSVGLATDYAGNPIYGTPDVGVYEYQPPHTIGTNEIDIFAGARIYGDGKFRDLATTSGMTADLTVTPASGSFDSYTSTQARPDWLDIIPPTGESTLIWEEGHKKWKESSDTLGTASTLHTIGDLTPDTYYNVKIDDSLATGNITGADCTDGVCKSDHTGYITFLYTGHYSTHTFDIATGDNTPPTVINGTSPKFHTDTTQVTLSLTTDENSTCHYGTVAIVPYEDMTTFTNTGKTTHTTLVNSLTPDNYTYYAICQDTNANETSYTLTFEIAQRENDTGIAGAKLKTNENNQTLDEDKKIYFDQDEGRIKGQDKDLANGTVKIYKEGKRIATVDVNGDGSWSKKVTFSHDKTYTLKLKFYDQYGTLRDEKTYDVKVDTEKPIFTKPFSQTLTIQKDDKINFEATDDTGVDYYKIQIFDKLGHIARAWKKQTKSFYLIPEDILDQASTIVVRAYDKAGNYAEEEASLNIGEKQPNITNANNNASADNSGNESSSQEANNASKPNTCSYTVVSGDTLWSIAKKVYDDATGYQKIIDLNKDKYTDIESKLLNGQELTFCDNNQNSQTTENNSNINNFLPTEQAGSKQSQPETKAFHWWNPFTWLTNSRI
jgi:LysM repeat protein